MLRAPMARLTSAIISLLVCFLLLPLNAFAEEGSDTSILVSAARKGEQIWGHNGRLQRLDLNEAIKRALRHNHELKIKRHEFNKAEARFKEANIIGRPVITYENQLAPAPKDVSRAVESFFEGDLTVFNRVKIGIGIPVTTFGKISRAKRLARNGIEAASQQRVKKESEVVFKVKQLYYGVLLAREVRRLVETAYGRATKEIRKREDKGGTNPVALLKLKIFRSDMQKKLDESNKQEILALEALHLLLGLERGLSFDVKKARLRPIKRSLKSYSHHRGIAYRQRADIKLLQIGVRSAHLNYDLEKYRYAPNLGVGAFFEMGRAPNVRGVTTTDDFSDPFNFTRAGIGLQLKGKFDWGTRSAKISQAQADSLKVEIQADLALGGILLQVKKAYLTVKSAKQELDRAEEASKFARQVLFLTQSNFDIGLAEPKDLIDAISQFLITRGDFFKAVFEYNVSFAELDKTTGTMGDTKS